YAAGAATSLGVAILAGGRVFAAMKKSLGASEWIRRGLGTTVLLAVAAIALGLDTNILTRLSLNSTNRLEQSLIERIAPPANAKTSSSATAEVKENSPSGPLPIEGSLPSLAGATTWLNSPPLTPQALRGKVVLVDFWTYSCINCLRTLPYVKAWYAKYKDYGLVVIGVHAPEFAFEKDLKNVQHAVQELAVAYPVALDNDYAIWQRFNNQYWPAHYFIDASGNIRAHHFGEGNYAESEQIIRRLLTEAGARNLPPAISGNASIAAASGIQAASDQADVQSPETYVGYKRAENFVSPGGFARGKPKNYVLPATLQRNQWGLTGDWRVTEEKAMLSGASGAIAFRFRARDLHLVLGPGINGKPLRFHVLLDGAAPAHNHGVDTDASGNGIITEQRLYQLIRQSGDVGEHTFSIEFPDGGAQAFAFTFG
ncbi:MAG TPA: thioredoxin family protein, partial [Herbaspirillum sp.]|nr:thioredoxin family protein [Herbaspirillum sp.]